MNFIKSIFTCLLLGEMEGQWRAGWDQERKRKRAHLVCFLKNGIVTVRIAFNAISTLGFLLRCYFWNKIRFQPYRYLPLLSKCKKPHPETYDPLIHKFCSNTVNRLKLRNPRTHCEKQQEIGNNHSLKLNSWFLSMSIICLLFIHILAHTLLFRVYLYMLAIQKLWFCSHQLWHRANKSTWKSPLQPMLQLHNFMLL